MENSLMVIGPLALLALGLLGYLVYVWLQYCEDSSRMEVQESKLHHQANVNLLASEQARTKTSQALERCRLLEEEIPVLRQQLTQLRQAGSAPNE